MKKILFILLGLLLLGGGGAGGWFYFTKAGAAEAEPGAAPSLPVFVEFRPLVLPIVGETRIEQLVTITLTLEVADKQAADRVIAWGPRLNDAFMSALYGRLDSRTMMTNGMIDVRAIKARVLDASASLLGQGVVRDCLVQSVSQRNLV